MHDIIQNYAIMEVKLYKGDHLIQVRLDCYKIRNVLIEFYFQCKAFTIRVMSPYNAARIQVVPIGQEMECHNCISWYMYSCNTYSEVHPPYTKCT
jgi:hypothetical protein